MKIDAIRKSMESVCANYEVLDHMTAGLFIAYASGVADEVSDLEDGAMTSAEFEALQERALVKAIGNLKKSLDLLKASVAATYRGNLAAAIPPAASGHENPASPTEKKDAKRKEA